MAPSEFESQFEQILRRLGKVVAGRYHSLPERLEDKYEVSGALLGSGSSGDIALACSKSDGTKTFAVKTINFKSVEGFDQWKMLEKQVEVAFMVDDPRVVGLVDVYEADESLHFVMPHLEGGQLIESSNAPPIAHHVAVNLARQMLLALSYMHDMGIVHRDVKPANFVFENSHRDQLKLIDFDLSTLLKAGNAKLSYGCGTPGYMSPELLTGQGYTEKTDMWSLGVTLFRLLVGEMPFYPDEVPDQEKVNELLAGLGAGIQRDAVHFLAKLLNTDPTLRLSAQEALRHPFVAHGQHAPDMMQLPSHSMRRYRQAGKCHSRAGCREWRPRQRPRGRTVSGTKPCAEMKQMKLLQDFDDEYQRTVKPAPPVQHKAASPGRARWADLDEDV
jgi:calcium/calmodulin-dependent protein kinase I